jgi:hypothetical protein
MLTGEVIHTPYGDVVVDYFLPQDFIAEGPPFMITVKRRLSHIKKRPPIEMPLAGTEHEVYIPYAQEEAPKPKFPDYALGGLMEREALNESRMRRPTLDIVRATA